MNENTTEADLDAATEDAGPERIAQRFWRPIGTQRVLQIVLGVFWILDAALQFQSFMFKRAFVETFILPNASGQPAVVSWVITNIGHFIEPHIAVWNTFFALIQLVIGVGLLFPRTVRPALGVSVAWVLGVWVLGEGMGMVLTGSATALSGAPGSVLIYGLIGLMAWPAHRIDDTAVGVDSSASAQGLGGRVTPLIVWTGYWSLAAVLFLLPQNRTRGSISGAITDMASGNPTWFDHFPQQSGEWTVIDRQRWRLDLGDRVPRHRFRSTALSSSRDLSGCRRRAGVRHVGRRPRMDRWHLHRQRD